MAIYNLSNESNNGKKTKKDLNKIWGIVLIVVSSIAFLVLLTNFIQFLKSFLLGVFGLFSYPLFITMFVIGMALINNKKYVMTTKYVIYLICTVFSLLCILHMLFIDCSGSFFEYLGRCYTQKMTVGGILTAPFIFTLNLAGAYIVFSILLIVFGALLADYIYYLNKSHTLNKPVSIVNQLPKIEQPSYPKFNDKTTEKQEQVNIVLNAKLKSEPVEDSARRKLGLIKSSSTNDEQVVERKEEKQIPSFDDKKSLREFLLTPETKLDFSKYSAKQTPKFTERMQNNINSLKNEQSISSSQEMPNKIVHDYSNSFTTVSEESNTNANKPYFAPIIEDNSENNKNETKVDKKEEDFAENVLASLINDAKLNANAEPIKPENSRRGFRNLNLDNAFEKPKAVQEKIEITPVKPKKQVRYVAPYLDLLTTKSMDLSELNEDVMQKRDQLENALETFGIPAKVIEVVVGPAVTRYELEMPAGISVKKILAHSDDIALNLAANGDIRIEAPIPGKSAVGVEVPNEKIATVGLRDMIASNEFQSAKSPLTFVLGKDITGAVRLCNLAKMPHLLVAGSTGSGKSVCLNAVILSLIYKTSPDDVRLILIDPKQVEFSIYNGLPHLLIPNVITDSEKALNALSWAVDEMERRYTLFRNTRTKDITEYVNCPDVLEGRFEKIPYIVIIIDEVADLLMTSKKDVEEKIARLAQKSRAAGIHLILATQRPSVDVITGTMKNNFTSRITFKLMSFSDSKTILDQGGAEKLLGKGDMLYKPSDASEPRRIQGCFVTTSEVNNIVEYVKDKNSEFDYDDKIETQIMNPPKQEAIGSGDDSHENTGYDPLMPQALKCVIENGQASISMLQRRLVIGYPRAARIIDQMQDANFISAQDGSKPRSVLITMEQYEEMFGDEE